MRLINVDFAFTDASEMILGTGEDIAIQWNGTYLQSGPKTGMWSNAPSEMNPDPSVASFFFDDFFALDKTLNWAETSDGTPGIVLEESDTDSGGLVTISTQPSTPADNDQVYLSSIKQSWVFVTGKDLWFEARVRVSEANTDDANIIVGLSDDVGLEMLVDNGAGVKTGFDGAVFFKVDGTLRWDFTASNDTTQNTLTTAGAYSSNNFDVLGFYYSASAETATPYVNGVAGTAQACALSGLQGMKIILGIKCGSASNVETLDVDYVKVVQLR